MSDDYVKIPRKPLVELLTCPLCPNIYREATTICVCLHTFCKQCIYKRFKEEKKNQCPVCNAYLGSFPEALLRNDHSLKELVRQIFPLLEKTSGEEGLEASPDENKKAETVACTLTEAKPKHQNFNMTTEGKRFGHDQDVAGNDLCLNQTENKSSNHHPISATNKKNEPTETERPRIAAFTSEPIARAFSLERSMKGPCQEHPEGREGGESYSSLLNKTNGQTQVNKGRRTKRKPCKFLAAQREDDSKIGTDKDMWKLVPSDLRRSIDSGKQFGETPFPLELPSYSPRLAWFCLLACQETENMALPQIPKPFITTKNGDLAVSFVNKFLARKLNLEDESEVEVMCFGHPLVPTLTLNNLIDIWIEAISEMGPVVVNCNAVKSNAGNFVMELTYRRRSKRQRVLESNLDLMEQ